MRLNDKHITSHQDQYLIANHSGINAGRKLAGVQQSSSTKKKTGAEELNKNLDEMHKFYKKDGEGFTNISEKSRNEEVSGEDSSGRSNRSEKKDKDEFLSVRVSFYTNEDGKTCLGSVTAGLEDQEGIASIQKELPGAKTVEVPDSNVVFTLVDLATAAHRRYSKQLEPAKAQMGEIFGEHGQIQARAKNPVSAANRLQRAIDAKDWGPSEIKTPEEAVSNLWDAIGTRVVLNDTSPGGIQKVVDSMADSIRSGKLEMSHLNNLRGVGGKPYFSDEQIKQIRQADAERREQLKSEGKEPGPPIQIGNSERTEGSPFTCVCGYVKHGDGVTGELQIIGSEVLKLADAEHLPYDSMIKKDLYRELSPQGKKEMEPLFKPFEDAIASLDEGQKKIYNQYLNQCYIHARKTELGEPSEPPRLPEGMSSQLDMMNILGLHKKYSEVKKKHPAD